MRIKTQFTMTMLLFGIILAVLAASAIITHQKIQNAGQQESLAARIAQGASELNYLSNDYLIYRESQQLKRWQSRFTSFSAQVAGLRADRPEQQGLIRNIQANEQRLKQVFDSVASAVGGPSSTRTMAPDLAFLQVSWSRMAVQSQALVSDASRLSQLLDQQVDQLREIRTMLMYVMVGLFGVFLLASYRLTYSRILKSLATLRAGTAVIGSGNLDFTVAEKENDEIGDLSRAFNQMAANLKAVTASKADLEREVTQRKRAEEELSRQREWLRVTLNSIGDAVIASDAESRITFLNSVAVTLTGWQLEEAMGQPIQDIFRIVNEKTRRSAEDLVARVLKEERVVALANDTALITKDSREIPIEDSAAPIKDATGNVIGVVLVFHDVTEKRRAQEALRKSERRYRSFVDVTSQFAWVTDASGQVVEDIPTLREFTGQTYEQAKGAGWSVALHPEDLQRTLKVWNQAISTKTMYEIEYRMRRHDGVYRLLLARGVPILNEQGNVVEWVGTCIDITERKHAEEALRDALERAVWLARFPGENPNPVVRASADGSVLYCNPASVEVHGWACRVGEPLPDSLLLLLGQAIPGEKETTQDLELGGRSYSVSVTPFPAEGYANVYGRDITDRKRAEDALRQRTLELQQLTETLEQQVRERTAELEAANDELRNQIDECARIEGALKKSESDLRHLSVELLNAQEKERKMIAGEIHDSIGSSLSAIKFKVESTMTEVAGSPKTTTGLKNLIPIVQGAIEEARRIQMNLRPPMLDDLGILATIRWFCRQFESTYSKTRISQSIEIEEHVVPASLRTVIFRVLQEGLNNVAKHSMAKMVFLSLRKTDQAIELVIQDNGQGFDLSTVQALKGATHGLGLESMRERTELSGGSLVIESTQGKGTMICASWPI